MSLGDGGIAMSAAHKTVKERDGTETDVLDHLATAVESSRIVQAGSNLA